MKINVIFVPSPLDDLYFTGKNSIVIDVLRTTTVICTALANGAKEIIPVASFEYAVQFSSSNYGGQTLLCGERNSKKIDGFNLGNSPTEYTKEMVLGKSIVLFTTNGTKAITKARFSKILYIASFLNISAVAKKMIEINEDFEIICGGKGHFFNLEDSVCAGKIIMSILKSIDANSSLDHISIELSDSASAAYHLARSYGKNLKKMLYDAEHAKVLIQNGFESDLVSCSKIDILNTIPSFHNNIIKHLDTTFLNINMV